MDEAAPATKRSLRRRRPTIEVAVLYNVDYEDARAGLCVGQDPSRSSVAVVAKEVQAALSAHEAVSATLVPVDGDFAELRNALAQIGPDCVFNLCESLGNDARLETAVPILLDLMGVPYTGSQPDALSAALYKDRVKRKLLAAGVPSPRGVLYRHPDDPCDLTFPVIVKPSREDGSTGIHNRSVVRDPSLLRERVAEVIDTFSAPCLVEEYIAGREFNVALLGYPQARVLPLQEIDFSALPPGREPIVSYEAKWRTGSVDDVGTQPVMHPELPSAVAARVRRVAIDAFRALALRDYGRVDVRLAQSGIPYVVDVNPNCDLGPDAGFARAAQSVGIDYPALVRMLVRYAVRRRGTPGNGQALGRETSAPAEARG